MKTMISALAATAVALSLGSCNYLDKLPDGDMTMEDAFSNYMFADRFLANTYFHLPNETLVADSGPAQRSPYMGGCDEMEITFGDSYTHLINNGGWNPQNVEGSWAGNKRMPIWSESYMGIRKVNLYLENLDRVPVSPPTFTEDTRKQRRGEGYFLRAIFNFHLLRAFGPYVILDHSLPTDIEVASIKRGTLSDCVKFIVDDCDRAAGMLPMQYNRTTQGGEYGRGTAAAALALKSRTLLYAASDLFNGNPDYASFTDNDGVALFPAEADPSLWEDAADAALYAITELEKAGYGLYEQHDDPVENFHRIYLDPYNKEWIFWRNIMTNVHGLDRCANPISVGGFSILSVTQEMVDAYQMADGSTPVTGYNADGSPVINASSGYVETGYAATDSPEGYWTAGVRNMYVDREPRFYACVNFAGRKWKSTNCSLWFTGADGRGTTSDYCKTGYLLRKYANPSLLFPSYQGLYQNHAHFFRFGELYLNYAEAINEAGEPDKAYYYMNRIRTRAGLPELPTGLDQRQMRERIRHERRIELAFENHRFFDVRRWKTADQTENKPIHGMNIFAGTSLNDDAFYVRTKIEDRVFEKQHYLFPIPQDELDRSERVIVQNPWW